LTCRLPSIHFTSSSARQHHFFYVSSVVLAVISLRYTCRSVRQSRFATLGACSYNATYLKRSSQWLCDYPSIIMLSVSCQPTYHCFAGLLNSSRAARRVYHMRSIDNGLLELREWTGRIEEEYIDTRMHYRSHMHTEDRSHHGRDFAISLQAHFLSSHPRSQGCVEKFIGLEMSRNSARRNRSL